jgi:thiol-disulfide isomerase/thioredoxin
MAKQWVLVAGFVGSLTVGAVVLAEFGPQAARVEIGAPAPDFEAVDLATGDSISLHRKYHGAVTLVNIWATWCAPCREELPAISQGYERYRSKDFQVVAIDYGDEDESTVESFWSGLRLVPQPYLDPDLKAATAYGVGLKSTGLPVSVLIDRQGKVAAYEPYPLTSDFIDQALSKIL